MKRGFLTLTLILIVQISSMKAINAPPFYLTTLNNPAPGYLIMDNYQPSELTWIDNSCKPVNDKKIGSYMFMTNLLLQPNGLLTYYSQQQFYALDSNYNIVDSFKCAGNYFTDYHELILLPNGHAVILGQETRMIDMSTVIDGGKKNVPVSGNIIQELDEKKNVIFQWNVFDHYKLTDHVNTEDLKESFFDFSHINCITFDLDSNLVISSRFLDEITKIDRKTGDIIWRLGGSKCKNNQFRFLNDTIYGFFGFSHQHSVSVLPNGNLLLFDNGNSRSYPFSRAVEYQINEVDKTIKRVWQYRSFPDTYSAAMGSVQRLPNGNTLIGWGANNRRLVLTEVHPDNSKAMELSNFISYRVRRYVYKEGASTKMINKPGLYDFNDGHYPTGVSIDFRTVIDTGYISVERHFYKPYSINLFDTADKGVYPNRWVINNTNIKGMDATIRFDLSKNIKVNPLTAIIYARSGEGTGSFFPLDTRFDSLSNKLEADISGFGEFILCIPPKVDIPTLNFPVNNSINIETNTMLSWKAVEGNRIKYRFQLSKSNDFETTIVDTSNLLLTNFEFSNLEYETLYYWRVMAFDDTNESEWSQTWNFKTMTRQVLAAPVLLSPMNNILGVPVSGIIDWLPVVGANYYDVELSLTPDFQSLIIERNNLKTSEVKYNNLDNNTKYYWRVSPFNDVTSGPWSDIWTFTTELFTSIVQPSVDTPVVVIKTGFDNSISFQLMIEESDDATLIIYNFLGSEIVNFRNKYNESGKQIITVNSERLCTGIYFYKIIISGKIYQGKFII